MAGRPVYSKLIFRVAGFGPGSQEVDMPPGVTWVIRSVDVYSNTTTPQSTRLYITDLFTNATFIFMLWEFSDFGCKTWRGRQVIQQELAPGGVGLYISNTGDHPCDISISGYELTLP